MFRLEDKSVSQEGDNVRTSLLGSDTNGPCSLQLARPTIWRVYTKRNRKENTE